MRKFKIVFSALSGHYAVANPLTGDYELCVGKARSYIRQMATLNGWSVEKARAEYRKAARKAQHKTYVLRKEAQ